MNRSVLSLCPGLMVFSLLVTSPAIAQVGACCFPDCTCILTTEEECMSIGGAWYGDLYDSCDPNPCECPPGACCFEDCSCLMVPEDECSTQGGVWMGEGDACDPNPCSCPPGACCLPDGSCFETVEFDCGGSGGDWLGGGLLCDPNPCPQPGACCYVDGMCVLMTFEECLALEPAGACLWMPEDMCNPNPCPNCPTLACCLPDGTCHVYCDPEMCEEDGGEVLGCFCENHPCPPAGACCIASGVCLTRTPTDCALLGGEYIGHEVPCDPDPCGTTGVPGSSTETVTWGRIKSRYR